MRLDLCKLFNVEEGKEFYIDSNRDIIYIIKDNKLWWREEDSEYTPSTFRVNDINLIERIYLLPKKKEFSEDTLNFFKCIDKRWKYIAKHKNGIIRVYGSKPVKNERYWYNDDGFGCLEIFKDSLFTEIKWEDEEPIYIPDYVER